MRVLVVSSGNSNSVSPFVMDQAEDLKGLGIDIDFYVIKGNGMRGYLNNLSSYNEKIREFKPDIIHAHYGLSGLFANFQRKAPVVTTMHGDDINLKRNRIFSLIASILSHQTIVVNELMLKSLITNNVRVIPCGVNSRVFVEYDQTLVRKELKLSQDRKYVLFSSSFSRPEKNSKLAFEAINLLKNKGVDCELLELKGYSRIEVAKLFSAVDAALLTSIREGSPQFVKEALATNCPLVSVDIGDVRDLIRVSSKNYIVDYDAKEVAKSLETIFIDNERSDGRKYINDIDSYVIARKIIIVYNNILKGKSK
jgi:teichuronic acid biosynthesis glycosyltransferase TuaC